MCNHAVTYVIHVKVLCRQSSHMCVPSHLMGEHQGSDCRMTWVWPEERDGAACPSVCVAGSDSACR
jgi:murein endopeptidase